MNLLRHVMTIAVASALLAVNSIAQGVIFSIAPKHGESGPVTAPETLIEMRVAVIADGGSAIPAATCTITSPDRISVTFATETVVQGDTHNFYGPTQVIFYLTREQDWVLVPFLPGFQALKFKIMFTLPDTSTVTVFHSYLRFGGFANMRR